MSPTPAVSFAWAITSSVHRIRIRRRSIGCCGRWLRRFTGASVPVGIDPDGREHLEFIPGEVAIPPYPTWVQSDDALGSIARLLRRMHDVSTTVPFELDATWSSEKADPAGGEVFCHNDVCLENVVFRDGVAVGLLDFDFAAPGRREFDLASFARMCVPINDDVNAARLGGQERFDRRRRWWAAARIDFDEGLQ